MAMMPTEQASGVVRRRVGDTVVTALNDGMIAGSPDVVGGIDAPAAEASPRAVFDRAARGRLRVAGMHMNCPGFAYVAPAVGGYALVPAQWMPGL